MAEGGGGCLAGHSLTKIALIEVSHKCVNRYCHLCEITILSDLLLKAIL